MSMDGYAPMILLLPTFWLACNLRNWVALEEEEDSFRLLQYLCSLHDKCAPLCCAVGVRVVDQPDGQSVSVNGTLRLTCNVSGSEPISYQWLKDGQQLQDDGRVSGSNASVLVVDPVEGDDFGRYRCNASNDVDQVQSEVAVVAGEYLHSDVVM